MEWYHWCALAFLLALVFCGEEREIVARGSEMAMKKLQALVENANTGVEFYKFQEEQRKASREATAI